MDIQSIERSSLFSYSIQYFWYKKRSVLLKLVDKYIKSLYKPNYKICDIGCEIGHDIFEIYDSYKLKYNLEFTGIDINNEAINIARERSKIREEQKFKFITCDIEKDFNFISNEKYDIIIISEVFEHLKNPKLFLENIKKILNEKSIIILSTPNLNNLTLKILRILKLDKIIKFDDYSLFHSNVGFDHISLFEQKEFFKIIEKQGLKIEDKKRVTFFYGNKFLDKNPVIFALYILFDILFDKFNFLNSFSYNNFYAINKNNRGAAK